MKNKVKVLISLWFLLIAIGITSPLNAEEPPWKDTWKPTPDINMHSLVNDGYKIVGTNFILTPKGYTQIEIIYLMKNKSLYRCSSVFEKRGPGKHECQILISPEKP